MAANDTLNDIKSKGILWGFGVFALIVVVILIFLGAWWGSEPGQFNVQDEAVKRAEETHSTDSKGRRTTHHHYFSIFSLILPKSFPELEIKPELWQSGFYIYVMTIALHVRESLRLDQV